MNELLSFILDRQQQFRKHGALSLPARLASLYSDFRHLQIVNPDGYAANISAWRQALIAAAREGLTGTDRGGNDLLVLTTGEDLLQALESKEWGRPLALGTVINESLATKDVVPLQQFLTSKTSIFHNSWTVSPWQILSWGLRQLGLAGGARGEDKLPVGSFVLRANAEECARAILKRTSRLDYNGRVYSKAMFRSEFSRSLNTNADLSQNDLEIILVYLARETRDIAYDGKTIKFKSPGETSTVITEQDTAVANLKTLIADHTEHIASLTQKIERLSSAARTAVGRNNKASALSSLRSRKLAESTLTKRSETLGQLEEVYHKIEQASDQVETIRVMEASSSVLKTLNSQVGGIERAERVVDQLHDEMDQVDEVGTVINEASQTRTGVDTSEVDDELKAMEREQREADEKEEAHKTQERLAELAKYEAQRTVQDTTREDTSGKAIEDSVAELSRLSLEEDHPMSSPTRPKQDRVVETDAV
ncbi:MAG: CCA tRNA nucleotidyltransferase, mitochondrial [Chaenotheca gracillima]|nr:MAG: CCA tRNA nucleotidyltransferase, mitochondrial [Chaenotheca gracillima]